MDYNTGRHATRDAADRGAGRCWQANGKDALKDFDGVFFIYAGGRVQRRSRRPVLAAPGERPPRRQALAVLHLPRRAATG